MFFWGFFWGFGVLGWGLRGGREEEEGRLEVEIYRADFMFFFFFWFYGFLGGWVVGNVCVPKYLFLDSLGWIGTFSR